MESTTNTPAIIEKDVVALAERAANAISIAQKLAVAREQRQAMHEEIQEEYVERGLEILDFFSVAYEALDTIVIPSSQHSLGFRLRRMVRGKGKENFEVKMLGYGRSVKDGYVGNLFLDATGHIWINPKRSYVGHTANDLDERLTYDGIADEHLLEGTWQAFEPFDLAQHKNLVDWERLCSGLESVRQDLEKKLQAKLEGVESDIQARRLPKKDIWRGPRR